MKKEIFVLTCVNEDGEVVSVELFDTYRKAHKAMKESYKREKRDAEESGYDVDDDYFNGVEAESAGLMFGSNEYKWKITKAELPSKEEEKKPRMWWVQIFNKYNIDETEWRKEFATTCEQAESNAIHNLEGWGVMASYPVVKYGDKVKWHDPAIGDYEPEDREYVENRIFVVGKVDEDAEEDDRVVTLYEIDGPTEVEAYEHELELVE